eukprot:790378-Lingulodinium_polyedra.AAC.1
MPRMSSVSRMGTSNKSTQVIVAPGPGNEMRESREVIRMLGHSACGSQVVIGYVRWPFAVASMAC